jgi:hypothetical protein
MHQSHRMSSTQIATIKMTGYNTRSKCQLDDFYVKCRDRKQKMDEKTMRQYNTRLQKRLKKEERDEIVAHQVETPYTGMDLKQMTLRKRKLEVVAEKDNEDMFEEEDEDYDSSSDYAPSEDGSDDDEEADAHEDKPFSQKLPMDFISEYIWPEVDAGDSIMQSKYQIICFVTFMREKFRGIKYTRTKSGIVREIIDLFEYLYAISDWITTAPEFRRGESKLISTTIRKTFQLMEEIKEMLDAPSEDVPDTKDLLKAYNLIMSVNEKLIANFVSK